VWNVFEFLIVLNHKIKYNDYFFSIILFLLARTNTNPGAFFVGAGVAASGILVVTAAAPGAFTAVP